MQERIHISATIERKKTASKRRWSVETSTKYPSFPNRWGIDARMGPLSGP